MKIAYDQVFFQAQGADYAVPAKSFPDVSQSFVWQALYRSRDECIMNWCCEVVTSDTVATMVKVKRAET